MVDGLILMMFLLFRAFRKTLHVATNTEETILDTLYERVNKILLLLLTELFTKENLQGSGGSKGGVRDMRPRGPNSFNFMQFLRKYGKILCWHPPAEELAPPPRGNPGSVTAKYLPHIFQKISDVS